MAVVAFSTMRTLSRVGYQILNVVAWTVWPEISVAFGAGNIDLVRTLHRRACQLALALSMACTLALLVIGPRVYTSWTRHAVTFDPLTFNLLLLVVLTNSFWYTSSVVPMAINKHEKIAIGYVAGTLISLVFAWGLMKHFGLSGAAAALLCIDISMSWLVLRSALAQVHDSPSEFAASMLSLPDFRLLSKLKGGLA